MLVKRLDIVSKTVLDRKLLFKVVKQKNGVISIDLSYDKQGRSAYISRDIASITIAKKKDMLSRALREKVDEFIYEQLMQLAEGE